MQLPPKTLEYHTEKLVQVAERMLRQNQAGVKVHVETMPSEELDGVGEPDE
jgi:hypothetical protein